MTWNADAEKRFAERTARILNEARARRARTAKLLAPVVLVLVLILVLLGALWSWLGWEAVAVVAGVLLCATALELQKR